MTTLAVVVVSLPNMALAASNASMSIDYNAGLEDMVRAEFADIPVMVEIARCESQFTQYGKSGRPLHGGTGTMIGLFQISEILHRATAEKFDWNIDTPEGNMAFARYLYEKNGTSPWLDSKHCWNAPASASRWKAATAEWEQRQVLTEASMSVVDPGIDIETLANLHQQLTLLLQKIMQMQGKQTVAIKTI